MKISSSILKGRGISPIRNNFSNKVKFIPYQRRLRPTTSKVKEALFNILGEEIKESCFLDLYAGTGAIGFEALSRGASEVVFVEEKKSYTKKIKQLAEKYGLTEKISIATKKVLSFIREAEANRLLFDIIFLDPPYHTDEIIYALSMIGRSHILKQEGVVIAEYFKNRQLPERFDKLQKIKDYKYGDTVLSLYKGANYE